MLTIDHIKLAVFDLDDTLFLEYEFAEGGFWQVAKYLGDETLTEKMIALQKAGRRDIFQSITKEPIHPLIKIYRTAERKLTIFPDADRAINRFRAAGKKLAILTDGPLDSQRTKIELLNLKTRFDTVIYTQEIGHEKPDPHCFQLLMKQYNLTPAECIYLADNEVKDFYAPNTLGWRSVKIARPNGVYSQKSAVDTKYKPEFTVDSLDNLIL